VDSFRLIGYENRSLNDEDFENDSTDAGEIGATQTITAMYEVRLLNIVNSEKYAQFDFRYKKPFESQSRLIGHEISMVPANIYNSSENMRFAASVAGFGLMMKQSKYSSKLSKSMIIDLGEKSISYDPHGYRKEFIELIKNWNY
jgi:Ca-activated chloride channel family protein